MIKTTMKIMNQLNKKGLEYNNKTGRFSPKGEHSGGRINCSKPKKYQDKAKGKGKAIISKKKNFKNHGRAYVGEWISNDEEEEDDEQEEEEEASDDEDSPESPSSVEPHFLHHPCAS